MEQKDEVEDGDEGELLGMRWRKLNSLFEFLFIFFYFLKLNQGDNKMEKEKDGSRNFSCDTNLIQHKI